jgi:peptidoglycan/xylan/chitin deacetylase (PgdA/CDA1 family)
VTFDDGYRSVVSAALPALAARSWPAVLNLTFKNVGLPGD